MTAHLSTWGVVLKCSGLLTYTHGFSPSLDVGTSSLVLPVPLELIPLALLSVAPPQLEGGRAGAITLSLPLILCLRLYQ